MRPWLKQSVIVTNSYYAGNYMMINTTIFTNKCAIDEYQHILIVLNNHTVNSIDRVKKDINSNNYTDW